MKSSFAIFFVVIAIICGCVSSTPIIGEVKTTVQKSVDGDQTFTETILFADLYTTVKFSHIVTSNVVANRIFIDHTFGEDMYEHTLDYDAANAIALKTGNTKITVKETDAKPDINIYQHGASTKWETTSIVVLTDSQINSIINNGLSVWINSDEFIIPQSGIDGIKKILNK